MHTRFKSEAKMAGHTPGIGLVLLGAQCFNIGMDKIPLVTFTTMLLLVFLYLRLIPVTYTPMDVCISANLVLSTWSPKRFLLSQFEHGNDLHLYFNMASFMWKGRSLENRYGSLRFAILLLAFIPLVNLFYLLLASVGATIFQNPFLMQQCAIGFSGVIFALKVITTYFAPDKQTRILGLDVSNRYAVWAEVVLIQVVYPQASLIGHMAGVLVGILYVHGPFFMESDYQSIDKAI